MDAVQIPEAVRKQAESADALHRKMYPDQYPKTGDSQTQGKETQGAATPEKEKVEPAKAEEEKAVAGDVKPEAVREVKDTEDWKQKYLTLEGKYKAEVPALHTSLAALRNQLQEAQTRIKTLEEEKANPPEGEKKEEAKEKEEEIDPAVKTLKEEYPDIFDAVQKMMGPKKEKEKEKEKEKTPAPERKAENTPGDARSTMIFFLNRDVPEYREINHDPEFIASLQAPDPITPGMTKNERLQQAWDANDFTTVIGYFRDFKASKSSKSNPEPGKEKELSPEERQLAPAKGNRGPGTGTGEQIPTVTPADLTKFYEEARRGLWGPLHEERYRKEEARLLTALTRKT